MYNQPTELKSIHFEALKALNKWYRWKTREVFCKATLNRFFRVYKVYV